MAVIGLVWHVEMYASATSAVLIAAAYLTLIIPEAKSSFPAVPPIIWRSQWGARSPKGEISNLKELPAPYVIIHHSTGSSCDNQASCQLKVKQIQNYHMDEKNWSDIGYNFLIGEDGNIYEGRGWDKQGAHSVSFNNKSLGICILGDYSNKTPNAAAVEAIEKLIRYGVIISQIKDDYKLLGHRQTSATQCPGTSLYTMIQSWDHWSASA